MKAEMKAEMKGEVAEVAIETLDDLLLHRMHRLILRARLMRKEDERQLAAGKAPPEAQGVLRARVDRLMASEARLSLLQTGFTECIRHDWAEESLDGQADLEAIRDEALEHTRPVSHSSGSDVDMEGDEESHGSLEGSHDSEQLARQARLLRAKDERIQELERALGRPAGNMSS